MFLRYYEADDEDDGGYDPADYGLENNGHCWIDDDNADHWDYD